MTICFTGLEYMSCAEVTVQIALILLINCDCRQSSCDFAETEFTRQLMEIDNCTFQTRFTMSQANSSVGYTHVLCCPCCIFFTLSFASLHKHALAHEAISSYRTYTCSKCLSTSTEEYLMLEHVNIYHRNTKVTHTRTIAYDAIDIGIARDRSS